MNRNDRNCRKRIDTNGNVRIAAAALLLAAVAAASDYGDRLAELTAAGWSWVTTHGPNGTTFIGATSNGGVTYSTAEAFDAEGERTDYLGGEQLTYEQWLNLIWQIMDGKCATFLMCDWTTVEIDH